MEFRKLGNTDIDVSLICLGTMTWGQQNTEAEAHEQLNYAVERGINFIDTAEMYPVPGRAETQGLTEKYIGTWLNQRGKRDDLIIASKVTGRLPYFKYIHNDVHFTPDRIKQAIEGNLSRLQTDYIDLYQLHFPDRSTNFFGRRGYDKHDAAWEDDFYGTIEGLDALVKEGKIRYWGVSNETPWGLMHFRDIVKETGMAGMPVSIQNPYSLLNRSFETGLAEIACRENIGLLAYSPLAFGRLTSKYIEGTDNESNRINQFKQLARYNKPRAIEAAQEYYQLAKDHGLSFAQMALAFINSRDFLTSNIIGATNMDQLKENIDSIDMHLSPEVLDGIHQIYELNPDPSV